LRNFHHFWLFSLALLFVGNVQAQNVTKTVARSATVKSAVAGTVAAPLSNAVARGDSIYAAAKPRLLQIRTLLKSTGNQASIGSGFLVSADGLIVTNYHVISQVALEPSTYHLEFLTTSGERGALQLLAFDVVNDLAVVRLPYTALPSEAATTPTIAPTAGGQGAAAQSVGNSYFEFAPRALKTEAGGGLQKGERMFSMGNPLDLGFTIVEGTYNSLVVKSYGQRIHFSGAINPGMSGGPTVDTNGQVIGINVAKRLDGDLVSFLVPARFAVALLERVKNTPALDGKRSRTEIDEQLKNYQAQFVKDLRSGTAKKTQLGSFEISESAASWLTCWGRSNAEVKPKPRFQLASNQCSADTGIFLANDLFTGQFRYAHTLYVNEKLSSLQFPRVMRESMRVDSSRPKRYTAAQCQQEFIKPTAQNATLNQRVTICARAYRDLETIYDMSVSVISQNGSIDGLVSDLSIQGVGWDNGMQVIKDFVGSVKYLPDTSSQPEDSSKPEAKAASVIPKLNANPTAAVTPSANTKP
jgi:serine protease Do